MLVNFTQGMNRKENMQVQNKCRQYFKRKKSKVYYSLGTRCTWKEKLPTMNNSRYTLLYGIAPNVENISLEKFKQEYHKKPIELFINRDYVRRIGEKLQEKEDNNTLGMTANLNYLGVVIEKCRILDSCNIVDKVENEFTSSSIRTHIDEIRAVSNYCRSNNIDMFTFPAKYKEINPKLSTMRLVKPASYIIVNYNIIADVAIGADNITEMINRHKEKSTQSSENKTQEKTNSTVIDSLKQAKTPLDIFKAFDRK